MNAISNSAELLGESLNRFFSRYKEMQTDPALRTAIAPLEADIKDDLEAVETILLSSRHQKRIADGKHISNAHKHGKFSVLNDLTQMFCISPK